MHPTKLSYRLLFFCTPFLMQLIYRFGGNLLYLGTESTFVFSYLLLTIKGKFGEEIVMSQGREAKIAGMCFRITFFGCISKYGHEWFTIYDSTTYSAPSACPWGLCEDVLCVELCVVVVLAEVCGWAPCGRVWDSWVLSLVSMSSRLSSAELCDLLSDLGSSSLAGGQSLMVMLVRSWLREKDNRSFTFHLFSSQKLQCWSIIYLFNWSSSHWTCVLRLFAMIRYLFVFSNCVGFA